MQSKRNQQPTFFDLAVQQRGASNPVLDTIAREVDFTEAEARVAATYGHGGRPAARVGVLLRVMILQHLYGLSDPQAETQINDRLSFQKFLQLDTHEAVPDEVGHTDEAKKEIQSLFKTQTVFDTPKPMRLVERVLQITTIPGDLILDSFAGSGTTGHAVLNLNKQDGGNRKFILAEMESKIARDITRERVKRVAEGYTNVKGETVEGLGGGFRFCELGEPLFDEHGQIKCQPVSRRFPLPTHGF